MTKGLQTPVADMCRSATPGNATAPMRALWCEALRLAVTDAVHGARSCGSKSQTEYETRKARDYFLQANPDLEDICTMLGLDADAVRYHVRRQIDVADAMAGQGKHLKRTATRGHAPHKNSTRSPDRKRAQGNTTPGLVSDFGTSQGTGGGTTAQDSSEINFSEKAA